MVMRLHVQVHKKEMNMPIAIFGSSVGASKVKSGEVDVIN